MRQGETGLGGDGAVIGRQRARGEGQRPLAGGDIGGSRGGRRRRQREAETVCKHKKRSPRPIWGILPRPSGCRKRSGGGFSKLVSRRSVLRNSGGGLAAWCL